jgi:hypothetical protein
MILLLNHNKQPSILLQLLQMILEAGNDTYGNDIADFTFVTPRVL